jgi:hypothetical protein
MKMTLTTLQTTVNATQIPLTSAKKTFKGKRIRLHQDSCPAKSLFKVECVRIVDSIVGSGFDEKTSL